MASTTGSNNIVKLWDLRKLVDFQTLAIPNTMIVNKLSFDRSGYYLATAGDSSIR